MTAPSQPSATYKLRLNVDYEGKKFMLVLTNPAATVKTLKESIASKLSLGDISGFTIENDQGFLLETDLEEEVQILLDDKELVVAKKANASVTTPPVTQPPPQPIPPAVTTKVTGLLPRWEDSFKFQVYSKESGFSTASSFPLPPETETLHDYLSRVLKLLGHSSEETKAFIYHESGAPLSSDIAQQRLVQCREVIMKDQYYYLIPAPASIDPHQPYVLLDPMDGADEVKYDLKGRVFSARVTFGKTTYYELKQKIAMTTKASPRRLRIFIGIDEQLDDAIITKEAINDTVLTIELNTGRMKAFIENFDLSALVTGQTVQGLREFKSCLYVVSKRYKNETGAILQGVIRYLSQNNAPMLAAFKKLREKKILTLAEKVAVETGFYSTFRRILDTTDLIKDKASKETKVVGNVFEYSRVIFMAIFEMITKILPSSPITSALEAGEYYKESDFVCPYSMKQIESPVEVKLDNDKAKICEQTSIENIIKQGKEVEGIKDPKKVTPVVSTPLTIMKTVFYCMESPTLTYWVNSHTYDLASIAQQLAPYPLLSDEDQLSKMADTNEYLRIYNAHTIKYYGNFPCLILDTAKLYGVAEQIMDCGTTNVYYDVTKGDTVSIQTVAVEVAVKQAEEIKDEVIITEPPEEVIVLLFDTSGSMQEVYIEGIEKMRAAKSFFYTFADRAMGYGLKSAISLILFNHTITVKCQFTERFRSFKRHVEVCKPNGSTRMYDALLLACENLKKFGSEYPAAIKRIIVFSDGEDTGSKSNEFTAAKTLRDSKILVDSVVVGTRNQQLKGISLSTGGYSYFFTELEEGIQLFENETFLKATLRKKKSLPTMYTDTDLQQLMKQSYSNAPPEMVSNPLAAAKVVDPAAAVAKVASQPATSASKGTESSAGIKRIIKEITSLTQNPQPNFYFFPSENDPRYWKLIMIGPSGCPYEGYTFVLSMQFPIDYPFRAPEVRFITPIYHCNVSKTGKICHSIFTHNYSPSIIIKEIMIHLNNMLIEPNIDDQIENSVAQDYYVDRALYYSRLEENCKKYANLTLEQRLEEMGIKLSSITLHHPQDYLDPVTKQLILDPVMSPVSGYSFEKNIILDHLKKKGTDPVVEKPLRETDLKPNEELKKLIQKYMASIYGKK